MRTSGQHLRLSFLLAALGSALAGCVTVKREVALLVQDPAAAPQDAEEAAKVAKEAAEAKVEEVKQVEEAKATTVAKAAIGQGMATVDMAGNSAEAQATAAAQAATQEASKEVVDHIEVLSKEAEMEAQVKSTAALEGLASNANTKAKDLAAQRLNSAVKDGQVVAEDLHDSTDNLEETMKVSQQASEQAAHYAVNAAKTSMDVVKTMEQWHPKTAYKDAMGAVMEVKGAVDELSKANLVGKLSGEHSVKAKTDAATSKTLTQAVKMEAEAAYKQTQKSKKTIEVTRMEIMQAKKQAAMAVSEARNAVFKAQDAAKKIAKMTSGESAAFLQRSRQKR